MRHSTLDRAELSGRAQEDSPAEPAISEDDAAAVREQTQRILEDPLFRNSKRYTDLLRFIVDRTLLGQLDDLHERIIGIEVFGRPPNYDTSADPTVRVTATEIRKRLALYYTAPAHAHELRIDLPVRSYVADFKLDKSPAPQAHPLLLQPVPEPIALPLPPPPRALSRRAWYVAVPLLLIALLLTTLLLYHHLTRRTALDQFWAPLSEDANSVLVCIGVSFRHPPAAPPAAAPQQPDPKAEMLPPQRGLVPMTDVNAAITLGAFLQHKNKETNVVPADGTSLSDLRNTPAVLVGSYDNEWTLRLGADLPYRFQRAPADGRRWIESAANPSSQIWALDIFVPQAERNFDYGLVSRVFDPTTGHWWIGLGGLSGLGTYAAQQVITDPVIFARMASQLPKDWAGKNIQIVFAVKAVHGSPGVPQVVAAQSW